MDLKRTKRHGMPKKETYLADYEERNSAVAKALAGLQLRAQGGDATEDALSARAAQLLKEPQWLLYEAYKPENRKAVITDAVKILNATRVGELYEYSTLASYAEQSVAKAGRPLDQEEKKSILAPMYASYNKDRESWNDFLKRCMNVINLRRKANDRLLGTRRIANHFSNIKCYRKKQELLESLSVPGGRVEEAKHGTQDIQVNKFIEEKQRLEQEIEALRRQLLAQTVQASQTTETAQTPKTPQMLVEARKDAQLQSNAVMELPDTQISAQNAQNSAAQNNATIVTA